MTPNVTLLKELAKLPYVYLIVVDKYIRTNLLFQKMIMQKSFFRDYILPHEH